MIRRALIGTVASLALATNAYAQFSGPSYDSAVTVWGWDTTSGARCLVGTSATCATSPGAGGGGGSSGPVYGADAVNAAPTHAPVYTGGIGTDGYLHAQLMDAAGRSYVNVYSLPAITGSVSVTNFPATQAVSNAGTFAVQAAESGTWSATALCTYMSTPPVVTSGNPVSCQSTANGELRSALVGPGVNSKTGVTATNAFIYQGDSQSLFSPLGTSNFLYNGATQDEGVSLNGVSGGSPTGVAAVGIAPTTAAGQGIVPVPTTAPSFALVGKTSAGNLFGYQVSAGATAGYFVIINATAAPATGSAITPAECQAIAANGSIRVNNMAVGDRYGTGITALFSSSCYTYTQPANAAVFIRLSVE